MSQFEFSRRSNAILGLPARLRVKGLNCWIGSVPIAPSSREYFNLGQHSIGRIQCPHGHRHDARHAGVLAKQWAAAGSAKQSCDRIPRFALYCVSGRSAEKANARLCVHRAGRMSGSTQSLAIRTVANSYYNRIAFNFVAAQAT